MLGVCISEFFVANNFRQSFMNGFLFLAIGSTSNPSKCPIGKFSNKTGNTQVTDCTDCTQGYYCETEGLTAPTGPCAEGEKYISSKHFWTRFLNVT